MMAENSPVNPSLPLTNQNQTPGGSEPLPLVAPSSPKQPKIVIFALIAIIVCLVLVGGVALAAFFVRSRTQKINKPTSITISPSVAIPSPYKNPFLTSTPTKGISPTIYLSTATQSSSLDNPFSTENNTSYENPFEGL